MPWVLAAPPGCSCQNTITPGALPGTTSRNPLGKPFTPPLRRSLSPPIHGEESSAPLMRYIAITHLHSRCYVTWLILHYPERYNSYKTVSNTHLYICKT